MASPSDLKGTIVLVSFPFDDLSSEKVRPAFCLTNLIGIHQHIVVAFITSRVPPESLPSDLVIPTNAADFASTGLRVTSTLRLHRLATITSSIIRRELGRLGNERMKLANQRIGDLLL